MSGAAALLPKKRIRLLEARLKRAEETTIIGMEAHEVKGKARRLRVGGVWSMKARRYIAPLPADWKPSRVFEVSPNQYEVLLDFYDAMHNDDRVAAGLAILQDILIHGGRRSGKTSVLMPAGAMAMILWPGSIGMIIGPRKNHGERILRGIRRTLDPAMWTYDKKDSTFRLINTSFAYARNATNYDAEIGEGLRWLVLDEAATLPEVVYEKLAPSLYDHNGVCCMSSTPRKHNWYYKKYLSALGGNKAIRTHRFRFADNAFLSAAAIQRGLEAAATMSEVGYKEEVDGEFMPATGIAFGDFSEANILDWHQMTEDRTAELCTYVFGHPYQFTASVDFNYEPTIGTIKKFDKLGRPWIIGEVSISGGATDSWGFALHERLTQLGAKDPTNECVIIADASGDYQGTGRHAGELPGTWRALESQGWHIETPTGNPRQNPRRKTRIELVRSLVHNKGGERRLFVDPDCQAVIEMFQSLPLKNGVPDKKSKHVHTYDGATYDIYRIWGTDAGEAFFGFKLVRGITEKVEDTA